MKLLAHFAKYTLILSSLVLLNMVAQAQDSTLTATTTTTTTAETTWYTQPWAWVVGGVVFLLLLVALFRGKSGGTSTDRVTVTKTVRRDTDV